MGLAKSEEGPRKEALCLKNRGPRRGVSGDRIEGNVALCHVRRVSIVLDIVGKGPRRDDRCLAKSKNRPRK